VPSVYHIPYLPFRKGDISTLAKRGHFYFGLTGRICDASLQTR
jgi:hypothetical protein